MRTVALALLASCTSVTPPQPPAPAKATCDEACKHEAELGCLEVTVEQCTRGCEFYEREGVDQGNACVLRARSCDDIVEGC